MKTNFEQVGDALWDQFEYQVWEHVRRQLSDQLWDQVWDQLGEHVRDQVMHQVWDPVGTRYEYGL